MIAAQAGDACTYERLLLEILPYVRQQVAWRVHEPAEREDIVQNVLISVHRARHTYSVSARTAEDRIRELARDLAPVRPIPALRWALVAAVVLGVVGLAAHWLLGGPDLRHAGSAVWSLPYLGTLAGLLLVALGALGASLAASVPGREAAARLGARVAAAGVMLAVGGGLWGLIGGEAGGASFADCLSCAGRAVALGAAPTLLACAFAAYTVVRRPGPRTALAVAGGVALGAAAVHATCPSDSPLHWLLAHTLAPVVAVLVLTAPIAALLARLARRG